MNLFLHLLHCVGSLKIKKFLRQQESKNKKSVGSMYKSKYLEGSL